MAWRIHTHHQGPSQQEQKETEAYRAQKLREYKATEEKEKGNAQYKKGKCLAAIACYTRAIEHDPSNAVYPANRAMAHLKMKQYKKAVEDCTIAVKLDKKYTKAWLRRATALVGMGCLEDAVPDFEHVLKLDPKNANAKKELASKSVHPLVSLRSGLMSHEDTDLELVPRPAEVV